MTAVTVAATTDYTGGDPTNYAGLNNQEPSSPTLSSSDLWLVDPTQLGGETSDTLFPEYSVTNLTATVDDSLVVPFDNIDNEEPEITLALAVASDDDTFQVDDPVNDSIDTAVTTGNIDLASSTSSTSVGSTESQLADSSQVTSFSEASGGSTDGSGGGSGDLAQLTSDGTSGSGTEGTDSTGTGESTDGTTTGGATTGETTTGGTTTGEATTGGTATSEGTSNSALDNNGTFETTAGETVASGAPTDPTDVPFSLTESLGLGLLIGIVGFHKVLKQRKKALKTA